MEKNVTVSIIMGVYNCASTLDDAIDSILKQTFSDWEFIICDDGSTDSTYELLCKYTADNRFKILRNESNKGLSYTLNKCLHECNGKYIARMDGDDISMPQRFSKQVDILNSNPQLSIVSSPMFYFDESGIWGEGTAKEYPDKYTYRLGSPYCHAPCMVRKEAYMAVQGYSEDPLHNRCEDYYLWYKMMCKGIKGMNIQEPLYMMRDDKNAFKRRSFRDRIKGVRVQFEVFKGLNMPMKDYVFILKGFLLIFVPPFLYKILHNRIIQKR